VELFAGTTASVSVEVGNLPAPGAALEARRDGIGGARVPESNHKQPRSGGLDEHFDPHRSPLSRAELACRDVGRSFRKLPAQPRANRLDINLIAIAAEPGGQRRAELVGGGTELRARV